MNNKKLSRLLEPNLKLYFFCLLVFSAAAVTVSWPLALVEGLATVALYVYSSEVNKKRRQGILQYIDSVTLEQLASQLPSVDGSGKKEGCCSCSTKNEK